MQKLIAKFGCAAHLAVLTVAPLFLFPLVARETLAIVMLWLSLPAALWTILEPSVRGGEHLHDARRRVLRGIVRDPLAWASLVIVVVAGVRAINTGIALAYDAETSKWFVAEGTFPILPGSVGTAGMLPFAVAVALTVLLQGHRHSLGLQARMAFLLIASALGGIAAAVSHLAAFCGQPAALALLEPTNAACSFVGFAYGLLLLCGTVALVAAFECRWNLAMVLLIFSVGGTAAGAFSFSPAYLSAGIGLAELILLGYSFFYSKRNLQSSGEFKMLVIGGTAIVLGGLMAVALLPEEAVSGRLDAYANKLLFPGRFWETRALLSHVALKAWLSHLWIGTGLDSFLLDFRFHAAAEAWTAFPRGVSAMSNGWWQLLAERGIVGFAVFALPFGFLLFTYGRRLVGGIAARALPHPACLLLPLGFVLLVAVGFCDCSPMRADALLAVASMMAVSAASFPRKKRDRNG
ncbi:MAG: hypothetical protein ACI4RD_06180 [Kiritimatiellia bacterium]